MSAKHQINLLADYIMAEIPGEPSQDEGAGDTAIRLLKAYNELRPSVRWFAEQMEKKLKQNDDTKPSWLGMDMSELFRHLEEEVKEVDEELRTRPGSGIRIIQECADTANLAMMIADNHNPLANRKATER